MLLRRMVHASCGRCGALHTLAVEYEQGKEPTPDEIKKDAKTQVDSCYPPWSCPDKHENLSLTIGFAEPVSRPEPQ